jgi:5-hydroxyisourate hydrolase
MTSPITTHVLNTTTGKPATGIAVTLEMQEPDGSWTFLAQGTTDNDGRLRTLLDASHAFTPGIYRLSFEMAAYFAGIQRFYPTVPIVFDVRSTSEHYHVPLLISPFGYSTYRGS